jgi:2-desacetyl-2-hydroxyethyl bacteriochlorophyllide A dehydrogenase
MKSAVFRGEKQVEVAEVPKPGIKNATDALVKITLAGVCGSDLHIYDGRIPGCEGWGMGHEFVGVVEETGSEVRRFKKGDRVVSSFFVACGHCHYCVRGWFNQCVHRGAFGYGEYFGALGGAQAEYVTVPLADSTLENIPEGMSDEQAIFVGDILATGFFAAERAEIKPGDTVAVVGAGPVGLMAVMCAQLFGPARLFIVDMVDSRLEFAQGMGAIPVNAKEVNPVEFIKHETGGFGVDSSIEAVGALAAVETAIQCVKGGGTISMVGVPNRTIGDFPYVDAWQRALTFRAGWCNVQAYMRPLLDLVAAGRLKPESIISHRMKLAQAEEAYRMFDAREATKIVLIP